ncbi:hypothetical protein F511_45094 [Dorcoceras hygrometricum]|uniref:Uncharacterized protein n=1 Tax=Dorcoceras hygrometricum TaxID=472368 RepID=A0A2Z7A4M9_9LAMI|nr:hypothetical protein F511_45094 [Dorcoceras hygrometricum]
MSARDLRAGRAREANAGRNSTRNVPHWMHDDGLAVRKRLRKWPVDVDGRMRVLVAPPRAYVAQSAASLAAGCAPCCAAGRCDDARRCARWALVARAMRCGGGACPLAPLKIHGGGGRRPAAAPASLQRCRDGWSDFF